MDERPALYVVHSRPQLDRPVLVMAPEGWIDAGLGGATAQEALLSDIETEVIANFDADMLLDHRARRPTARIVDGVYEDLVWPEIEVRAGHDAQGHDVLLIVGPEPDHLWRAYAEAVGELAVSFGVRMLVGLGAFPAPVPHTRPASLAATATSSELARSVGVVSGTLEVPAGVLVAVERRFAGLGIPAVGLWARVPHYAAAMAYPEAAVLLLEGLAKVSDVVVDTEELADAAAAARQRLDELTANSAEHSALVRQLESRADAEEAGGLAATGWENLPTADELGAEVERFLEGEGS
ncbi:MAG TPA: PAC2 family protein [Acidimicrobiales bacterium]|jgi:predicted ATP-grasp superfamily ATP-dependent carboligase|nr:PAC2 family protein [Acidimicrobiales bacterium]